MSASRLGLRYERLLLLAAPISFAALLVLFIAIASDSQKDRVQARCFDSAADVLAANESTLNAAWNAAKLVKDRYWGGDYKLEIAKAWIFGLHAGSDCYKMMDAEIESRYRASPSEIIGQVSAIPEHFFDVNVTKSQRWLNGLQDASQNFQNCFIEGNHGILGPNRWLDAFDCFVNAFSDR